MSRVLVRACCWSTLLLAASCSVINSFDEVGEIKGTNLTDSGSDGSLGGTGGGSDSGSGGGTGGGDSDAATGGAGGSGTGGLDDGGGGAPVMPGLVVASGLDLDSAATDSDRTRILSVLSPQTGEELIREELTVTGVVHDLRQDIWLIFKTNGKFVPAPPGDEVTVEARKFDRLEDKWTVLTETPLSVPGPQSPRSIFFALLNGRLAYLAFPPDDATAGTTAILVILDISDPGELKLAADSGLELTGNIKGVIGSSGTTTGGGVNVVLQGACNNAAGSPVPCDITLQRISVTATGATFGQTQTFNEASPQSGAPAFIHNFVDDRDVVAFPPTALQSMGQVLSVTLPSLNVAGSPISFTSESASFTQMAFAPCLSTLLVSGNADSALHAIPLESGGTADSVLLSGGAGAAVLFEPFTSTVLAPHPNGLRAFNLAGTGAEPTLSTRSAATWSPPPDLGPAFVTEVEHAGAEICR